MALVHDYLTQHGGAERVVLSMLAAFPDAPLYTALFDPRGTYPEFRRAPLRTSPLNRLSFLRARHRLALPLLAPAFSALTVEADVAVCSSSGWAHGTRVTGRKVVYCHSPAKWLYQPQRYFAGESGARRAVAGLLRPPLVRWDRRAAWSADRYLANSSVVARWVQDTYGVEAEVVAPPHAVDPAAPRRPVEGVEPGFFLCISRLLPYKNVGAVADAVAELGERLVIVGRGPAEAALKAKGARGVTFVGTVADDELRWLYSNSRGVVAASYEDFGLVALEAAAFGQPMASLRWGGFLDTVVEGETGLFFDHPVPAEIARCLRSIASRSWSPTVMTSHAAGFSRSRFQARLREVVAEVAKG